MGTKAKPWLSHYPEEISPQIDYGERPLFDYLREAAEKHPDKSAIYFMGKEMTYRDLYNESLKLAQQLTVHGLKKGDRLAIMLPNSPQSVIAYYAALMVGGIVVQTNPLYMERELQHQLSDSGAKMIVCLDQVYPRVRNVQSKTSLETIIVTGVQDYLPLTKKLLYPIASKTKIPKKREFQNVKDVFLFTELIKKGVTDFVPEHISPEEDLALLQYTGGTTGFAKGVMLTHRNLIANTEQSRMWQYRHEYGKDTILGVLPFFHVYGMTIVMNLSIMHLSKMIIVPRFEAGEVLKMIEKLRPTVFSGAPTMYIALINHPDIQKYDLSSIKTCISGSAPLPLEVQQRFEQLTGGKLVEGYGLTEASPVTHCNLIWGERILGSIGIPYPDTEAKIVSPETGEELGLKEVGELVVKGPQVMKGYWNRPEETAQVLKEGWLFTGDMAYMDEKGYFYIVDRKKDMILASGFNIYPREVEEVLYEHPDVKEAAVVGVHDHYRGETVKAFVVAKDGRALTEEELNRHCRKYLAAYKVPKIYEFRKDLPKSTIGKILKRELLKDEDRRSS
ncbi:long-chain acyl-CoA synthetase [Pullulanibacillus pueri]|uniref:Long-chain-fatty-acid--CoA ligase n=1 Tax=Pullulanibacillus pueri TaxID=1437324 RepID=A0A8J2ZWI1_9BACL|nr:AMP-binding protein [Pullulanibacillus pueri]MBM7682006.1 long-chain acyl-CoA synthetase [Pullulanibacillus pueri]GGH83730.1 long-chain-fatty-acid--CoA ligase [Pullulanibacillus pueri]